MAMSIFARIGAIQGESRDATYQDQIDVLAWSWGVSHSGTVGRGVGAGAGKASFRDLAFTHQIDKASPLLMTACATGERLPDATITVRRAGEGQREHLVITMTDVLVTGVSTSMAAGGDAGDEEVSLSFATVDLEYKPQQPDGALDAGIHFVYDVRAHRAG